MERIARSSEDNVRKTWRNFEILIEKFWTVLENQNFFYRFLINFGNIVEKYYKNFEEIPEVFTLL